MAGEAAGPGPDPGGDAGGIALGARDAGIVRHGNVDPQLAAHRPGAIDRPGKLRPGQGGCRRPARGGHGFAPDWRVTTGAGAWAGAGGVITVASPAAGDAWPAGR